jgi:hypothetical protein
LLKRTAARACAICGQVLRDRYFFVYAGDLMCCLLFAAKSVVAGDVFCAVSFLCLMKIF